MRKPSYAELQEKYRALDALKEAYDAIMERGTKAFKAREADDASRTDMHMSKKCAACCRFLLLEGSGLKAYVAGGDNFKLRVSMKGKGTFVTSEMFLAAIQDEDTGLTETEKAKLMRRYDAAVDYVREQANCNPRPKVTAHARESIAKRAIAAKRKKRSKQPQ